jgi:hypothetical protein
MLLVVTADLLHYQLAVATLVLEVVSLYQLVRRQIMMVAAWIFCLE